MFFGPSFIHTCVTLVIADGTCSITVTWHQALKLYFDKVFCWFEKEWVMPRKKKDQHLYMMVNLRCGQSITYVPVRKRNMKFPWNEEGSVGAIHRSPSVRKVMGRDL